MPKVLPRALLERLQVWLQAIPPQGWLTIAVAFCMFALFLVTGLLSASYSRKKSELAQHHFRTAAGLAAAGKQEAAIEHLRESLKYAPDRLDSRLALAEALVSLERFGEAQTHLRDILRQDPTSGIANLEQARIEQSQRRYPEAATLYRRAVYGSWPPGDNDQRLKARRELIALLLEIREREQASAEIALLSQEAPADPDTRCAIGNQFLAAGNPQDAGREFEAALAIDPRNAAAHLGLAESRFAQGDYARARVSYERAMARGAGGPAVQVKLDLSRAISELDPTLPRLSFRQRLARSRQLVRLAIHRAQACSEATGGDSARAFQEPLAAAESLLRRPAVPGTETDIIEEHRLLADRLWIAARGRCRPQQDLHSALGLLLEKMRP